MHAASTDLSTARLSNLHNFHSLSEQIHHGALICTLLGKQQDDTPLPKFAVVLRRLFTHFATYRKNECRRHEGVNWKARDVCSWSAPVE